MKRVNNLKYKLYKYNIEIVRKVTASNNRNEF